MLLLATLFTNAILSGQEGAVISGAQTRANLVAEEGLEAVRNMRDSTFINVIDGTYGIGQVNGTWTLVGTSDIVDIYTRSVTIQTVDPSTKQVTSTVSWSKNGQRSGTVSLVTYLTDTSLLVPQIKKLQVDISGGHISANTRLVGIKIKNIGSTPITLSTTTVAWVGGSATTLNEIDITGGAVWSGVGPGYPLANQPSGGSEGLLAVVISPNSAKPINNFVFNANIHGAYFIISFIMSDNSSTTITTPVFP